VNTEETQTTYDAQDNSTYVGSTNIYFTEHNIFTKLENLKLAKFPGPGTSHHRILHEIRHKIAQPFSRKTDS